MGGVVDTSIDPLCWFIVVYLDLKLLESLVSSNITEKHLAHIKTNVGYNATSTISYIFATLN